MRDPISIQEVTEALQALTRKRGAGDDKFYLEILQGREMTRQEMVQTVVLAIHAEMLKTVMQKLMPPDVSQVVGLTAARGTSLFLAEYTPE